MHKNVVFVIIHSDVQVKECTYTYMETLEFESDY